MNLREEEEEEERLANDKHKTHVKSITQRPSKTMNSTKTTTTTKYVSILTELKTLNAKLCINSIEVNCIAFNARKIDNRIFSRLELEIRFSIHCATSQSIHADILR